MLQWARERARREVRRRKALYDVFDRRWNSEKNDIEDPLFTIVCFFAPAVARCNEREKNGSIRSLLFAFDDSYSMLNASSSYFRDHWQKAHMFGEKWNISFFTRAADFSRCSCRWHGWQAEGINQCTWNRVLILPIRWRWCKVWTNHWREAEKEMNDTCPPSRWIEQKDRDEWQSQNNKFISRTTTRLISPSSSVAQLIIHAKWIY